MAIAVYLLYQQWKNFLIIMLFSVMLFAKFCHKPIEIIIAKDKRIDTLTNSLTYALAAQRNLRDSIEFITLFFKNKPPQIVVNLHHAVTVYDTIRTALFITDTFRKDEIITVIDTQRIHIDTSYYLRLPYIYALQDDFISLKLSLTNTKKSVDSLTIINALTISNTKTTSFFYTTKMLSFENSNPYISTVTPIYTYRVERPHKIWADRLGGFFVGLGVGVGSSYFLNKK